MIKFLKAGKGDSILIQSEGKNILIDGGDNTEYLKKELYEIEINKEKIDLLIITHHDDDHVIGIIDVLNDVLEGRFGGGKDFIKQVIFNSPKLIRNTLDALDYNDSGDLSYSKANTIESLLLRIKTEWKSNGITTLESEKIVLGELTLEILSPSRKSLDKYAEEGKGAMLSGGRKCDWITPLSELERWVDDKNLDFSIPNSTSIVINLNYKNKNILLTGDTTPQEFSRLLTELYSSNNNAPVIFDYVKLPHHGSYRNLSEEILSKIDCQNYIVTTNGDFKLPDKKSFLKIRHSTNNTNKIINFYFNYGELIPQLNISSEELNKYHFNLMPNNEDYGYRID